jgi:hypothetical protein
VLQFLQHSQFREKQPKLTNFIRFYEEMPFHLQNEKAFVMMKKAITGKTKQKGRGERTLE